MADPGSRRDALLAWGALIVLAFVIPIGAVLLAHWFFGVSLPTLMFVSFLLLFLGGFWCYPAHDISALPAGTPADNTRSVASILVLIGHTSGIGVLILMLARLWSQGWLFSWM